VLFENLLILNGDHDGDSYIVALDKRTGSEVWKVPRAHKTRSYVTPIIRQFAGRTQMILSGSKSVASYNPRTGQQIWSMDGPTEQFVASMVDDGKHVFLTAGFPDRHILAIDPSGTGNVTESHIVWRSKRNCAYVPSPIVVGNYFLLTSDDGIASCYDTASGERYWFTRLGKHYSTSPVAAAGLVYFTADDGETKVIRPGRELEVVAENQIGEACYASAAVSSGHIFLRSSDHLICIGARQQ
jgi:outer membrane protein assembly factor BamB